MSDSDKSRSPRHHSGWSMMKKSSARKMRRLAAISVRKDEELPVRMPGMRKRGFCCGNHLSDWRY